MQSVSTKLCQIRLLFGYPQEFVATRIAVSQSTYCRYESGTRAPGLLELECLARFYGFTIGEFLDKDSAALIAAIVSRPGFVNGKGGG